MGIAFVCNVNAIYLAFCHPTAGPHFHYPIFYKAAIDDLTIHLMMMMTK